MMALVSAFLFKNWKYIGIALAIIGAFFWVQSEIKHMKQKAYDSGVASERTRINEIIAKENDKNRKIEEQVSKAIDDFVVKIDKTEKTRVVKENTYTDTIKEIVNNNTVYEECKVSQEVLDEKNKIRDLGPNAN